MASDDETLAGRAAADRLAHDWDNRDWVPGVVTTAWARAAVARLGEIFAEAPSVIRASMKGADKGASTLSPRPFQGIVECLQNADDLGATKLHVAYRGGKKPALLIVHDGTAVTLSNVCAMLLPWLSTKDADPDAAGRFGIGQRTLNSLGGPIALHAPPFHFVMTGSGPVACEPESDVPSVYRPSQRDTMLVIPLAPSVSPESIAAAVRELDADALIFLKSIRRIDFHHLGEPSRNFAFAINVTPERKGSMFFGEEEADVAIADIRVVEPSDVPGPRTYRRYSTRRNLKPGEKRSNKATGTSTPLAICVPIDGVKPLRLYDRMPLPIGTGLPIGLDAQFDPDAARSTLQPNKWNRHRFADLGKLVAWAAIDAFATDTVTAWNHVPLEAELGSSDEWALARVRELVVTKCHSILQRQLVFDMESGPTELSDLAYECRELEPLLTEEDVEELMPEGISLPRSDRDEQDRWRDVLGELGATGEIDVVNALEILDSPHKRATSWYVDFAALAEEHGLLPAFLARPGILLADGTTTSRPASADIWVLVKKAAPIALATRLGLARIIHPAYLEYEAPTAAFVAKLESMHVLYEDRDTAADIFSILGRGVAEIVQPSNPIRLDDDDLLALRDAWAGLPRERHSELGIKVGARIAVRATWLEMDGRRASGWLRPVELYLPATIDREVDSFAKAAARTPGLRWVDPEYAKLLKQKAGRSAIGAQRLLSAWGVAREPRLIRPTDERTRWARDPTPASPVDSPMRTAEQLQSIRVGGYYTDLIDDHWSPDAEAVARDIAKAPVKTRRKRAVALVSVLSRAWERRLSDFATAIAATAYSGWIRGPEVRATWLARLGDVKWMPDAGSGLQRPTDLQLQAAGTPVRPGERSFTVARFDAHVQRSGILAALGVKAGPTQRDLIERLRSLRAASVTTSTVDEVTTIYQLLASSLRDRSEGVPEGRMTAYQLRNAFRAGVDGPGLLLVGKQWLSPEAVLRGPAIFGPRRAFAPHIDGLEPLWKTLGVEPPNASDAIAVLKELSDAPPAPVDLGVAIRALKLVAAAVPDMSVQLRTSLRRLPLWIGTAWSTERPIYAFEGEALLASAPPSMPVWRPGLTSFAAIAPLLEPLGVILLTPSDFRPESTPAYGVAEGERLRPIFSRAVALLRQELVKADQNLLDSLAVEWDDLLAAQLVVDPELTIVGELPTGTIKLPATAHMVRDPLRLIVREAAQAGTAESGGAAVASLFDGDHQKAAWAWAAIWPRADNGERAVGAVLPKARAERSGGKERLDELARQAAQRELAGKRRTGKPETKTKTRVQPVQVRKLRELDELEPSAGVIVNEGAKPSGDIVFARRQAAKERKFGRKRSRDIQNGSAPARTVLPPVTDREKMALDAVRRALCLDVEQFNDLRDTRGVGVDAIDELRQCYEIKMSSGATMMTDVVLTASEVEAAKNDPDFFLAVVAGLEDGEGELRVRFIFDPLANLDVRMRSDLTLTGVDKAEALEFSFKKRPDPTAAS
ncbi:hypothetical protein GGR90_000738 [Sphingopyxis italica]|uniref:Protein NO VEIN C-terminal domain-containing protein n=1 Tax=Sphingopyxis italica TaxID=1129133 RepID=A0A7X5XPD3_9SPHN|nr:hypothetical protein [Sphingopyxis italica]NJB88586.1 hypothetical protein [Sphingopyxis italica]